MKTSRSQSKSRRSKSSLSIKGKAKQTNSVSPAPNVTMQDIAALVGVSRITVSKYFNGNLSIKAETRRKIEQACSDLHYVPDPHAVSLVKGKSQLIGVVLPIISEPFFAEVLSVIEREASAIGLRVVILCSYNDTEREAAALLALRSMKVQGIIFTPVASQDNVDLLKRLEKEIRVIYLDSYFNTDCHFVMNDNMQSISLVTRYLLSRGHNPAFLGAPPVAYPSGPERVSGYIRAMQEAGSTPFQIPVPKSAVTWDFAAFAMQYTLNFLGTGEWQKQQRDALICATDRLAIGAMAAFRKFGLEPGKDVAFVGHDDLPVCEYLYPALTTVKQDVQAIGRAVIECFGIDASTFTAGDRYFQRRFPARLIVRNSA
ncbi:MAG: LacI family DNA-binding transcriptional regulator [Gallionella sp.]